jgi:hypothetical protein
VAQLPERSLLLPLLSVVAPKVVRRATTAAARSVELGDEDPVFAGAVPRASVDDVCELLGDGRRARLLAETAGPGAVLHQMLEQDDAVPVRALLEFWLCEDRAAALAAFMADAFPGSALQEHATGTSFRYKIPRRDAAGGELRLSEVFGRMEDAKERLWISEYSLGQTTLEQIFNHFASSSSNPEVAREAAAMAALSGDKAGDVRSRGSDLA